MEFTDNAAPLTVDSNARVTEPLKDAMEWVVAENPGIYPDDAGVILGIGAWQSIEVADALLADGRIEFCEEE